MTLHPPRPIKKRPPRKTRASVKAAAALPKKKASRNRTPFVIAAVALVAVIIAGTVYYLAAVMPYQRVFLTVGKENVNMGYFLKRVVASSSGDPSSTVQQLAAELIIDQDAAQYGLAPVTAADIDTYMRNAAKGTNDTISDTDFATWLKDQLASTGLTEKEYREVMGRAVQAQRLAGIIGQGVQSTVPQVHLWAIVTSTKDAATAAKARIDGGEAFADVAKAVSTSPTAKTDGGDLGWMPPELAGSQLSSTVDSLDISKCSDPVPYTSTDSYGNPTTSYFLLMVTEKSAAMKVTDNQLTMLKNYAMDDWLTSQESTTQVTIHGLNGSKTLDNQTLAWINYKVQQLVKKRPSTTSTAATTTTTASTSAPTTAPTTTPTTSTTTTPTTAP